MRSSAIGAGLLDFGPLWRPDGWQRASIRSASRISSATSNTRSTLRRGVRARLKGLLKRAAHRRRRDALTDGTLKIYEADLNGGSTPHEPDPCRPSSVKLQTIIKKVRRHLSSS